MINCMDNLTDKQKKDITKMKKMFKLFVMLFTITLFMYFLFI